MIFFFTNCSSKFYFKRCMIGMKKIKQCHVLNVVTKHPKQKQCPCQQELINLVDSKWQGTMKMIKMMSMGLRHMVS